MSQICKLDKQDAKYAECDVEHVKVFFGCPDDIKQWVHEVTKAGDAPRYNYPGWPADLWSKSAVEILDYLEDRFRETEDVQEYYASMLYLRTKLDAEELYVLWKDSSNFKALQAKQNDQNDEEGTNTLPNQTSRIQRDTGRYRTMLKYRTGRVKHGRV